MTTSSTPQTQPLTERPAWKALAAASPADPRPASATALRRAIPERGERLAAEAAGIYLDYSKNRITDETMRLLLRLADECGLRERIEAMFRGEQDQRDREAGGASRRAAGAGERADCWSTASTSCPRCTRCSTAWPPSPNRCAAAAGSDTRASASATSSTSASAAPTSVRSWPTKRCALQPARHDVPLRLQRGRHRLRGSHARPRSRRDAVHRLFEDLHDARNADQRPRRARLEPAQARRRAGRAPGTSSPYRPTPRAWRSSASTPRTCSASGTGSAAATRWIRRSACRP